MVRLLGRVRYTFVNTPMRVSLIIRFAEEERLAKGKGLKSVQVRLLKMRHGFLSGFQKVGSA